MLSLNTSINIRMVCTQEKLGSALLACKKKQRGAYVEQEAMGRQSVAFQANGCIQLVQVSALGEYFVVQ